MTSHSVTNEDQGKDSAKAPHTNMMVDCIIANLPEEALRSIMRGLLGGNPSITSSFQKQVSNYLTNTKPETIPELFDTSQGAPKPNSSFQDIQSRYRCLMGCGYGFESVKILTEIIRQVEALEVDASTEDGRAFLEVLEVVDGDIVQSVTAIQKQLLTGSGVRSMTVEESETVAEFNEALSSFREKQSASENSKRNLPLDFPFERGMSRVERLDGGDDKVKSANTKDVRTASTGFVSGNCKLELVKLGTAEVPRMFMGLWQFSSPAWGSASKSKINKHFRQHVDAGLVAYDMADHYGQFRSSQPDSEKIYCATKWAVFEPIKVTPEVVAANITERTALNATSIELLQFHWQDYGDKQYIEASRLLEQDPRISSLGLCNFDTSHMNEIVDHGIKVVSNQVQFSLIDLRPTFKMAESCRKHHVKLLTYGSLCGGFLASKWLKKPAPNLFDKDMTPSHRKYIEMITVWGGWSLFQELLHQLEFIGTKHGVSISCVAIRWVLDHDYVGAVIIGARMGISEHIEENLGVFSFCLDDGDREVIQKVLERSKARDVFEAMGDCGAEYR
ncbi:hypothetical protein HYFRA_00001485 [Hymenoscyphus fraxineus]|uniref:NADP-dependent oxidoreductase domain-containing protein n=1 Tax=Hymenoscyphus fraxineus TaxID=746836 RepID=A0A9N9L7N2_9HELO|nr:hypothetical protein HYFRA_00001485 [Hymenoscyphus fraxineus]